MTIIIKPYYSQVETPTVRGPILYSQEDPRSQAIQSFGRGVTALSEKLIQRLEQKKKEEEERKKAEGTRKAAESQAEFFKGELAKSGSQAQGAHQRGADFHVGLMKEVQDSKLPAPVKEGVLEHLGSSGRRILKNLARHEAVQHQAVKAETLQDRVKTWQTLAEAVGRDAEGADSILQDVDAYFDANKAWLNPELKAKLKGQVLPTLAEMVGTSGNLQEMHDFINRHRDQLDDRGKEIVSDVFNKALINNGRLKPPKVRIDEIESYYKENPTDHALTTAKRKAYRLLAEDFGRYADDPVGYLTSDIMPRLQQAASAGLLSVQDKKAVRQSFLSLSLARQTVLSDASPRILAKAEAVNFRKQFFDAPSEKKVDLIQGWKNEYGGLWGMALQELGLPSGTGYDIAANAASVSGDITLARRLMKAADLTDRDLVNPDKERFQILVRDRIKNTGYGRVLEGVARTTAGDARVAGHRRGATALVYKLAAMNASEGFSPEDAVDQAAAELDKVFDSMAQDGLGYVLLPKGSNRRHAFSGLEKIRESLAEKSGDESAAEDVRQTVWMNVGAGHLGLVAVKDGRTGLVADAQGRPLLFTPMEVETIGSRTSLSDQ